MIRPGDSLAIVTPTYPPDLARCSLLVESLDRCAPQIPHYLIVDRRDVAHFRHLQSTRTRIVESEDIVSPWLRRLPIRRGYWMNWRGFPVRGWIMQQIFKIAVANVLSEPILVYCDSDVAFIRPFDRDALMLDGQVGLLDLDDNAGTSALWNRVACRLLGLDAANSIPARSASWRIRRMPSTSTSSAPGWWRAGPENSIRT